MISVDELPDDVLLEIFDFYVVAQGPLRLERGEIDAWLSLVHVCRRWRSVVFGSSLRLNLRLVCSSKTPVRATIDMCPELPLYVKAENVYYLRDKEGVDNVVAALERRDRVDEIRLSH